MKPIDFPDHYEDISSPYDATGCSWWEAALGITLVSGILGGIGFCIWKLWEIW